MSPSLVSRPDFLAADARPFLRRTVVAASRSPFASWSAALHSIKPTPVFSRSSFTCSAETLMANLQTFFLEQPHQGLHPVAGLRQEASHSPGPGILLCSYGMFVNRRTRKIA